jgi:virginiamycin B lyase
MGEVYRNRRTKPVRIGGNMKSLILLLMILHGRTASAQVTHVTFTRYLAGACCGITTGPDGAVWFIGQKVNLIGRITTAGNATWNTTLGLPVAIVAGPDGALWFTDHTAHRVGRITTTGEITEFPIPCCGSPSRIAAGPDGALWFTEGDRDKIGRITTGGEVTEYPLPNPGESAGAIVTGPDGALWFAIQTGGTVFDLNKIGRITTDGVVMEFALPHSQYYQGVWSIVAGPDGALWFNEHYNSKIGRITTAGVVTEYDARTPNDITVGPDGALWFLEGIEPDFFIDGVHTLGRITIAGAITEYDAPVDYFGYGAVITTGPDGALWIADNDMGILRADVASVPRRRPIRK